MRKCEHGKFLFLGSCSECQAYNEALDKAALIAEARTVCMCWQNDGENKQEHSNFCQRRIADLIRKERKVNEKV